MKNSEYLEHNLKLKFNMETEQLIDRETLILTVEKGQIILWEGERAKILYFIIKGIVRGYYIDEKGDEITKCFSMENEFCSTEGFRTKKESSFTIETLERSNLIKIPYDVIYKIIESDEKIKNSVNNLYFKELEKVENRAKNLMLLNGEKRYKEFCKQYSNLQKRVELQYIASYIGVKPGSLSRIRKKLKINL